jgi:hypothetical protein
MITVEPSEIKITDQISALQTEIATRESDIQNLQEAIDTLVANKPRPINPSADGAFEMLRELVGNVPKSMEEQQLYQGKLKQSQRSLDLAIALCKEKQLELEGLQQKQKEIQAEQLFQELKLKAERFNVCITEVLTLLDGIKDNSREIYKLRGDNPLLGVYFESRETPWCVISDKNVLIKRKMDVK